MFFEFSSPKNVEERDPTVDHLRSGSILFRILERLLPLMVQMLFGVFDLHQLKLLVFLSHFFCMVLYILFFGDRRIWELSIGVQSKPCRWVFEKTTWPIVFLIERFQLPSGKLT